MSVQIYTDGGCDNLDGFGGYAALMYVDGVLIDGAWGGGPGQTNNTMELMGLIAGMSMLPTFEALRCTDCGVVNARCDGGVILSEDQKSCPIVGHIQRPVYPGAIVISDSQYCVKGASEWVNGWQKNGWKTADKKPVKNKELWEQVIALTKRTGVSFEWVKGHNGDPGNELADQWATKARHKTLAYPKNWAGSIGIGG